MIHTFVTRLGLSALLLSLAARSEAQTLTVQDTGLETAFQDTSFGHHKKGRANIAADFDLDGYIDFFVGNPGDESIILQSVPAGVSQRSFVVAQVLTIGDLSWGGVTFDYDNDGDYDLFISCGANEGVCFDYLFRNDWILDGVVTGVLSFTDVTTEAGVAGPIPSSDHVPAFYVEGSGITDDCSGHDLTPQQADVAAWAERGGNGTEPIATASAGAIAADYDQDGDTDLFVNGNIHDDSNPEYPELIGRNTLYRNNGDGTFTDVTYEAGLGTYLGPTRHSTFIDFDNDGDQDLYESNFNGRNILWRNNSDGTFTDVTAEVSAPGHDLQYPWKTFASTVADLNNDGWEDIIGFMRGADDGGKGSPYTDGHALFVNRQGMFDNIAENTLINDNYISWDGVMGCMVADATGDGFPDIYVGNGGPHNGIADQFYTSLDGGESYLDNTALIDFAAEIPAGLEVPPYPYRTHGVAFVDFDRDGLLEVSVVNGGTAVGNPRVREPNRLFRFTFDTPPQYVAVRPVGDGVAVSKDAIGTRIELKVSNDTRNWSVFRTLHGGNGFSAQNGFELHFYLSDATSIDEMVVTWPNGIVSSVTEGLELNTATVLAYSDLVTGVGKGGEIPTGFLLEQNYPNPFNPSTQIGYTLPEQAHVSVRVFDLLGREVVVLEDGMKPAGRHIVRWDASGNATGAYIVRVNAGRFNSARKMLLSK